MNIAEIAPRNNYMLHIKSDEGQTGLFDVKPYLESEAFAPLKDTSEFERITADVRLQRALWEHECTQRQDCVVLRN